MPDPRPEQARTMGPRAAAEFLKEHFGRDEQLEELQKMLTLGGHMTNLAHGIAVELEVAEDDELKEVLVTSLKMKASDLSVGYGGNAGDNAAERSKFAGQGPMYARMGEVTATDSKAKKAGPDDDEAPAPEDGEA